MPSNIKSNNSATRGKDPVYVIIPARNEELYLGETIRKIRMQDYPLIRILVVDSASNDGTAQVAKKIADHLVSLHQPGVARARNAGAAAAISMKAQKLVFIDADSHMDQGLISQISSLLDSGDALAGTSQIRLDRTHWRARLTGIVLNLLQRLHKAPHSLMFCTSAVFEEISFDASMIMAEDEKWAYDVMRRFGRRKYKLITKFRVTTSARRFEKYGYWNIIYKWWTSLPYSLSTQEKEAAYFDSDHLPPSGPEQ